jgi:hypothetical protein
LSAICVFATWQGCGQATLQTIEPRVVDIEASPTALTSSSTEVPSSVKPRTIAQARAAIESKLRKKRVAIDPASVPICPEQLDTSQTSGEESCYCAPERPRVRTIWGDLLYTSDSEPCMAARHAGVIAEEGGVIEIVHTGGCTSYPSASRNGVTSSSWNMWRASFYFDETGAQECATGKVSANGCPAMFNMLTGAQLASGCDCDAGSIVGAVWGDNPYTADSNPCHAAVHAGAIPTSGGRIHPQPSAGCNRYPSSTNNGVTTSQWATYASSFYFDPPVNATCKP